uniref:Unannotated protein n=1 Tax=freshwater metagenome TaxID=449393 RepID=A0A6J5ZZL3_9ZZZZ
MALLALPVAAANAAGTPPVRYYVAVGDSYAAGFQPGVGATRNGFVYQVPALARSRGYRLQVVNFGCSGATSGSIIGTVGCNPNYLGPGAGGYPAQTQLAAATDFIRANRAKIALISSSVGLNDVNGCSLVVDTTTCFNDGAARLRSAVGTIAGSLRSAAGPGTTIVGTTYPDVFLGAWAVFFPAPPLPNDAGMRLAKSSVPAFRYRINPALKAAYADAGASFADATAATGAYGSLAKRTRLKPWGVLPAPVANVCRISFWCDKFDIHLHTSGNRVIAKLVAAKLPKLR